MLNTYADINNHYLITYETFGLYNMINCNTIAYFLYIRASI